MSNFIHSFIQPEIFATHRNIAWGDMDLDGDLDLVVASIQNFTQPSAVMLNQGLDAQGNLVMTLGATLPSSSQGDPSGGSGIALGDVDGDGDLDIMTSEFYTLPGCGLWAPTVYRNDGLDAMGQLILTPQDCLDVSGEGFNRSNQAWGDMDGDGDLDLAIGRPITNYIFLNENAGGAITMTPVWSTTHAITLSTRSVAWGDIDRDGDLDLAVGGYADPSGGNIYIYRNQAQLLDSTPSLTLTLTDGVEDMTWGDINNNDYLELAVATGGAAKVYSFTTSGTWQANGVQSFGGSAKSVAWGDVDNDGDLDLALGGGANSRGSSEVYLNNNGVLATIAAW